MIADITRPIIVTSTRYIIAGIIVPLRIFRSSPFSLTVACAATMFVSEIMFPIPAPTTCNAKTRKMLRPVIVAASNCSAPNNKLDTVALPDKKLPMTPSRGDINKKLLFTRDVEIVPSIPSISRWLLFDNISNCTIPVTKNMAMKG